jgi:hypothetical protein
MIPDDARALVVGASGDIDDHLATNVTVPYALLRRLLPLVTSPRAGGVREFFIAPLVRVILQVSRMVEMTDVNLRPMQKPQPRRR